jgi:hypothetical protein
MHHRQRHAVGMQGLLNRQRSAANSRAHCFKCEPQSAAVDQYRVDVRAHK